VDLHGPRFFERGGDAIAAPPVPKKPYKIVEPGDNPRGRPRRVGGIDLPGRPGVVKEDRPGGGDPWYLGDPVADPTDHRFRIRSLIDKRPHFVNQFEHHRQPASVQFGVHTVQILP